MAAALSEMTHDDGVAATADARTIDPSRANPVIARHMANTGYSAERMASPCVGICTMDDASGYCMGCARTGDEIAAWKDAGRDLHEKVWREVPARRAAMGRTTLPLPWSPDEIADVIHETLDEKCGTWVLGVPGALGEFLAEPEAPWSVQRDGMRVSARCGAHSLRLVVHEKTRALAINNPHGAADAPKAIALSLLKNRFSVPSNDGLALLEGADAAPVVPVAHDAGDDAGTLFDLGLARTSHRMSIRVTDDALAARLHDHLGAPLERLLADMGAELLAASPDRVIDTGMGRLVISGQIPSSDMHTPNAPHTHLLPEVIALGDDTPPEVVLSRHYALAALFYPADAATPGV